MKFVWKNFPEPPLSHVLYKFSKNAPHWWPKIRKFGKGLEKFSRKYSDPLPHFLEKKPRFGNTDYAACLGRTDFDPRRFRRPLVSAWYLLMWKYLIWPILILIDSMTDWRHFDGFKDKLSDMTGLSLSEIQSCVTHSGKRSLIVTIFESGHKH